MLLLLESLNWLKFAAVLLLVAGLGLALILTISRRIALAKWFIPDSTLVRMRYLLAWPMFLTSVTLLSATSLISGYLNLPPEEVAPKQEYFEHGLMQLPEGKTETSLQDLTHPSFTSDEVCFDLVYAVDPLDSILTFSSVTFFGVNHGSFDPITYGFRSISMYYGLQSMTMYLGSRVGIYVDDPNSPPLQRPDCVPSNKRIIIKRSKKRHYLERGVGSELRNGVTSTEASFFEFTIRSQDK